MIDSTWVSTYTHSPGEGHTGPTGVVPQNRVKKQGLREAGLVVSKGQGVPWFLGEDVIGLFE